MMRKKKNLSPLGETEMEVLQHIWALKNAMVAQVHARVLETRKVAYTTIMTVMKKLADKGYLTFQKDGATYVYAPARSQEDVQQSLISSLVDKAFQGSPAALIQTLVKKEALSDAERQDILKLIEDLNDHDAAGNTHD